MAGKIRNLVNRDGRYHARLVVPKKLRGSIGKTELREPLGGDRREAIKSLPGAVAELRRQRIKAEQKFEQQIGQVVGLTETARYPMTREQLAHSHYLRRLAFDDELRTDPRYAAIGIDDLLVARLREAISGRVDNAELSSLVGSDIERYRASGNVDAARGTDEWRSIAHALCQAELEALARAAERDEGDFTGMPTAPIIRDAQPPENVSGPVSLSKLWEDYVAARRQVDYMRDGGKRQGAAIKQLREFLKHNDAARIAKKDIMAWRDHLMKTKKAKTVSDVDLATVRSLFRWAVENDRLPENVAQEVKQPKPRKKHLREKGYKLDEAVRILRASRIYEPNQDENGYVREKPNLVSAKRWVPLISAFTGARVSEITQLRKDDVTKIDGHWVVRITPEAGTVKTSAYRDVPLHRQVIEEGFIDFVDGAPAGPLFHNGTKPEEYEKKAKQASGQLGDWLRDTGLRVEGVQPNYGWRHRFKTQCIEIGILQRIYDALQGHSGRSASDGYGDVTLKAKIDAVGLLPNYDLS